MRRFVALFILTIAALILTTVVSAAAPPPDPGVTDAAAAVTYVYWTEVGAGTIRRGPADGNGSPQTCITSQNDPRGLVIAADLDQMYWIERGAGRLRRAGLPCPGGSGQTFGPTVSNADRLALDLVGGKLYWTENKEGTSVTNRIRRANLDGSGVETLLDDSAVEEPVGIAIDRSSNPPRLYWTDLGTDSIRRATLEGGNPQLVLQLAADMNPLDIALDPTGGRMYWASGAKGAIYSATLDGGDMKVWRFLGSPRTLALDPEGRTLYWGDWGTKEIRRDNLAANNNQLLFNATDGVDQPLGVALLYGDSVECYSLTRIHSGDGANPTASGSSAGCGAGQYAADETITLTAAPAAGWRVAGWSGTNNDASTSLTNSVTMPAAVHTVSVIYAPICYTLTRTHSGNGNNPVAEPPFSSGCGTGQYTAGQFITLTATPAADHHVIGWSGTNDDGSTSTVNSVTMPAAAHTVSVIYDVIPTTCYSLTRSHSGEGVNPVAAPPFSSGCGTGQYKVGEMITLNATPAANWHVAGWSGTNNDVSTSMTNSVTMPAGDRTVSVIYGLNPTSFAFFVPAVLYIPPDGPACFAGPNEVEDNDSDDTANGPLCAAGTFSGLANDERDFFMFDTDTAGRVAIVVSNLHVPGMQLSLYYQSTSNPPVDFDTEPSDGLDVELPTAQPGRYYIRVFTNRPDPAETRPYTMQLEFP